MTPHDDSSARDPLDLLVEEFLERRRSGEVLSADAFAAEHPEREAELRELLPTLEVLEQVKRDRDSTAGLRSRVAIPKLERLGDFRIIREVGRGGMGVVFEAVQESLSRRVALKVLPQASLLTGHQLMRFQREAQIAAGLHHTNIVPVFGSGETEGYYWYAMQFIAGVGLDRWRREHAERESTGSADRREHARFVASAGEQVAGALHYAHEQGTLHRDIKPANLLLGEGGHVWVTDFGLAKALEGEGLTGSGDVLGTLQYMAPEQFAGEYDARSEVYALGLTLYELLTLRPAFAGRTRSELMAAIRSGKPKALRRLCPHVPEDLAVVIEKATARDPRDRYDDAAALRHDLAAFLEDRPIAARRQNAMALLLRWCGRNRAVAALGATVLVLLVAAGVTGWVVYGIARQALGAARVAGEAQRAESRRAEANLQLSLRAIGDVFDALVGPDPLLLFEEDPDTGEQSVMATRLADADDVALLRKMLTFYDDFAEQNSDSAALRFETARAHRRMGVIHARLGQLDEAAAAYDQALRRYEDVDDRDVTRDLVAVYIDYSQLELRRMGGPRSDRRTARPLDRSSRWLLRALRLLEREPVAANGRALRFDLANVHLLLGRNLLFAGRRRGLRGQPGAGGRERLAEVARHAETALELSGKLAAEPDAGSESRALYARCLLFASGLRRRTDPEAAARERKRGLDLLRELAGGDPTGRFRIELCRELMGPRGRPRSEGHAERIAQLREAKTQAEQLLGEFPDDAESRLMRAETAQELGRALLREAGKKPEAEGMALRREAEAEFRTARELQFGLIDDRRGDLRLLARATEASWRLDQILRASGRAEEAERELDRCIAALRQGVARWREERGGTHGASLRLPGTLRLELRQRAAKDPFLRRLRREKLIFERPRNPGAGSRSLRDPDRRR